MSGGDSWDPALYGRFGAERRQPFDDLVALCRPVPGGQVVDLGCGTGELTAELHRATRAATTVGVDSSAAMLAEAPRDTPGLSFVQGDLAEWDGPAADLVFANASFQWVDDHPALLTRVRSALRPGGQLAFQVPANYAHVSHRLAREEAGVTVPDRGASVLAPEAYAHVLYDLGAREQVVCLKVYGHELADVGEVVAWTAGTLLTPYRALMDPGAFREFQDRYLRRLRQVTGDPKPYFYTFSRILCWARFP